MATRASTSVSAADANRRFSDLLRRVREGRSFVITSHGKPVAKIMPFDQEARVREAAKRALLERIRDQPVVDIGPWTRESLYEDDE